MYCYLFGLHCDGATAPPNRQEPHATVCGPENLLTALEAALGLAPSDLSPLQRTLGYRTLINDSLSDELFYARSFRCDPLATARLLLEWRDSLSAAGWHAGLDHSDAPLRLQCLAALEPSFRQTGLADATHAGRIANILAELATGSRPDIESLRVIDPPEILPRCWRTLFAALDASYGELTPASPLAASATTLGAAQVSLLGIRGAASGKEATIRIITAATPEAAADALACQLASLDPAAAALIADPSEREFVNRHLRALDLPLLTCKAETAAALLELPSLVVRCRIAPLDPQAWIEFLLHTVSPIPAALRRRLAEQINHLPGRGNHWQQALDDCIARCSDDEAITRLRQAFSDWIDAPLITPATLSGQILADTLSDLTRWLAKLAGTKKSAHAADAPEWVIAARAVAQLESLLRAESALTRTETDRLLAEWHSSASATTRFPGQVGSVATLASPAHLLAPRDHLIWWRPAPTPSRRSPWTDDELAWLAAREVVLPDETALALAAEQCATRVALFAAKSLTFYHVTQSAGGPTAQAGIVTRLLARCGPSLIVRALDLTATAAIPLRPLPPLRRWWDLAQPGLLPARNCESFSSVSKAITSPVDWVLDYHAKLSLGAIAGFRVCDDKLRAGSILHAAAEEIFNHPTLDWQNTGEPQFRQFLATIFPGLLASQAAHYLTPGYEAARARLLHAAQQSLWPLIGILRDCAITAVTLEQAMSPVAFSGGQIGGRIDLIARRADGSTAVIDLKLGGKTYRTAELRDNRHLQLATYGHLIRQSGQGEPATAFYILSNGGTLLTRNPSFFPHITAISPKRDTPASDWQECWREFETTYHWRRSQLDQGRIEVPVPGTVADDPPPIDRWAPPKDGNRHSPYPNLTGFPPDA